MARPIQIIWVLLCILSLMPASRPTLAGQAPEMAQNVVSDTRSGAAILNAMNDGLSYVPGELLVRFKPGAEPTQAQAALRVLRAPIGSENTDWIGEVLHLRGLDIDDPIRAAGNLARQPEVLYAQPNYLNRLDSVPNDPGYSQQWNLPLVNMPQAWDISPNAGRGIIVAVVDSGLTTTDGTFGFRLWTGSAFATSAISFAKAADFDQSRVQTGVDLQPFGGWQTSNGPLIFDADGHGTHVAGTIAQQTNNGTGYAGVANGVTILPIKACFAPWDVQMYANQAAGSPGFANATQEGCSTSAVIAGIRYAADNGAKVINVSIGGPAQQPAELDALTYAVSRGAFVAISAGNEGRKGTRQAIRPSMRDRSTASWPSRQSRRPEIARCTHDRGIHRDRSPRRGRNLVRHRSRCGSLHRIRAIYSAPRATGARIQSLSESGARRDVDGGAPCRRPGGAALRPRHH